MSDRRGGSSVTARGLLGATWPTVRAISLLGVLFVVARWSAITRTPPNGDATPQLSLLMFVVLPLLAFRGDRAPT